MFISLCVLAFYIWFIFHKVSEKSRKRKMQDPEWQEYLAFKEARKRAKDSA